MYVVPTLLTFKFHAILGLCVTESLMVLADLCAESAKKKRLRKGLRIYQKIFAQRFLVGCYLGQRFISFLDVPFSVSTYALLIN